MARSVTTVQRDVVATQVPTGFVVTIPKETPLVVQQHLGGAFTVLTPQGGLMRVDGKDADALGPEFAEEARAWNEAQARAAEGPFQESKVWDALNEVYDPEIPASIVELGLVYHVGAEPTEGGQRVHVQMTLTAPACGVGPMIVDDARRKVLGVPGVKEADVELVFDPPWDPSRMSEAAKLHLGML